MENLAQNRVIAEVENLDNLVKIVMAPRVDKVIRIVPLESRELDLSLQPQSEEWENIKRLVYLMAPLEERGKDPVPVGTKNDWTLVPEQVPVVTLMGNVPEDLRLNAKSREERDHAKNLTKIANQKGKPGRPKKLQEAK